jgi:hypothetical protein
MKCRASFILDVELLGKAPAASKLAEVRGQLWGRWSVGLFLGSTLAGNARP